jgi:CDP-paratose 2-epimerase
MTEDERKAPSTRPKTPDRGHKTRQARQIQQRSSATGQPSPAPSGSCLGLPLPLLGVDEWFGPDELQRVEESIQILELLGIHHIRVGLSWAEWCTTEGRGWYEWLIRTLSHRLTVLPSLAYVPPASETIVDAPAPSQDRKAFAEFLDAFLQHFGDAFEWIELPSEPGHRSLWDWRLDPRGRIFSEIIGSGAYRCRQRGVKTVLGGLTLADTTWLGLLCENGVIDFVDALGLRIITGAGLCNTRPWRQVMEKAGHVLIEHHQSPRIWITEAGCPAPHYDEFAQLGSFVDLLDADVERIYWRSLRDPDPTLPRHNGSREEEPTHGFGLLRRDGTPKLLCRLWDAEGIEGVREFRRYGANRSRDAEAESGTRPQPLTIRPHAERAARPVLITGGAGFIGSNLADRLLREGRPVILLDNLSRSGVERNVRYLCETHGDLLEVHIHDVRDRRVVERLVARCGSIFHFAAQVAVTTSLVDPVGDFESNLQGTVNVLEAARKQETPPPLLFTSTNKVYGDLHDIELVPVGNRHVPRDHHTRKYGVDESRPLDFHSPHGCSKGAADQYILDYARMYATPNMVFRMSCVYGRRQLGTEDQGWVAHFARQMLRGGPLSIYGDGRQVRDILYIDDLLDAMLLAMENIDRTAGQAFNIGGGPDNAVSLLQVVRALAELSGAEPQVSYGPRRQGDRSYYVSDTRRFTRATGWTPRISAEQGVSCLYRWLLENSCSAPLPVRG